MGLPSLHPLDSGSSFLHYTSSPSANYFTTQIHQYLAWSLAALTPASSNLTQLSWSPRPWPSCLLLPFCSLLPMCAQKGPLKDRTRNSLAVKLKALLRVLGWLQPSTDFLPCLRAAALHLSLAFTLPCTVKHALPPVLETAWFLLQIICGTPVLTKRERQGSQ